MDVVSSKIFPSISKNDIKSVATDKENNEEDSELTSIDQFFGRDL